MVLTLRVFLCFIYCIFMLQGLVYVSLCWLHGFAPFPMVSILTFLFFLYVGKVLIFPLYFLI